MTTNEPIVRCALRCSICHCPADLYSSQFQCQANPNHVAGLRDSIFSDLTLPDNFSPEVEDQTDPTLSRDQAITILRETHGHGLAEAIIVALAA